MRYVFKACFFGLVSMDEDGFIPSKGYASISERTGHVLRGESKTSRSISEVTGICNSSSSCPLKQLPHSSDEFTPPRWLDFVCSPLTLGIGYMGLAAATGYWVYHYFSK
jgi:hypothetical protein